MTQDTPETPATESRGQDGPSCLFCGGPVPPQKVRRGRPKVYCSPTCAGAHMRRRHPRVGQKLLDFDPRPHPCPPRRSEAQLEHDEGLAARTRRKHALLARLREGGPVRRSEVKAFGGDRFSARIEQLRAEGHLIIGPRPSPRHGIARTTTRIDGEDVYVLLAPGGPHAPQTNTEANRREGADVHDRARAD